MLEIQKNRGRHMSEYTAFTALIPDDIKALVPAEREHHAFYSLYDITKKKHPEETATGIKDNASQEDKAKLTALITEEFHSAMQWHVQHALIDNADKPTEIKRDPVPTDKAANKKILALVNPAYLKKIPFFVRGHATEKTCGLFAREFPDLYNSFKGEPTEEQKEEMKRLINLIFEERMAKHGM